MNAALTSTLVLLAAAVPASWLSRRLAMAAVMIAAAAMAVLGIAAAGGWGSASVSLGTWLGFGETTLRIDHLAGIFLGVAGVLSVAVTLRYLEERPSRVICALHAASLLALLGVVTTDQGFAFLLAWEALSVILYLTASAGRRSMGTLVAGYVTGALNKVSGAALLAAFGLLYGATHSLRFADWHGAAASPHVRSAAFVLLVAGFAAKVGVPPLHAALPAAYAAAPGPAPASLSIALLGGFYGLWRLVYETLAPAALWWGELLLVAGSITALVGILSAIAQGDMRRFLGFSSIEHTGIALLGLGAALVGQATGQRELVAAGILAATLHVVAHAIGKALALLAVDRIATASGTSELAPLGGLGRTLPVSAAGLGLASVTLAALPPFGGFVSEWFTLEALLQGFRVDDTLARLVMALAAAALALTAGLGLLAFAKLFGMVGPGVPRSPLPRLAEPGPPVGLVVLAGCALALGPAAPWEIRLFGTALEPSLGFDPAATAVTHPLVLGPVYPGFSVLAPTWLSIVLPSLAVAAAAAVRLALRRPVRRAAPWVCGTALAPEMVQYTPAAYSNPVRVVLRGVYGLRRRVVAVPGGTHPGRFELETTMTSLIEDRVYGPLTAAALAVADRSRKLQSGRLGSYLAYLLVVLLIALALIPLLRS
jgi:hydrogenase-4 component B